MKRVVEGLVGLLCVLVLAAILFPIFAKPRTGSRRMCLTHLKQSATAMLIYRSDADGAFPHRDRWVDATYPYTKKWMVFHCPQSKGTEWGYAFNAALDRANDKKLKAPEKVPMLYDSVNPIKNASDLVASLPAVPRHGRNYMAYADGHANALPNPAVPPTSQ